jgi:hypothetical protein
MVNFILGDEKHYGAWKNIQVISYITNRGQREHELRHVWKMHICVPHPHYVKMKLMSPPWEKSVTYLQYSKQ